METFDQPQDTKYVIRIDGRTISPKYDTYSQAAHQKMNLSEGDQQRAVIVPVTQEGKTILLG